VLNHQVKNLKAEITAYKLQIPHIFKQQHLSFLVQLDSQSFYVASGELTGEPVGQALCICLGKQANLFFTLNCCV